MKEDRIWAKKGHVFAWEQFRLTDTPKNDAELSNQSFPRPEKIETTDFILIKGRNFALKIDKSTGLISEYLFDGKPVIQNKVRFNFWRAMTDNDIGWKVNQKMKAWENEASQYQLKALTVEADSENPVFRYGTP